MNDMIETTTIPVPHYQIGQTVWRPITNREATMLPCPDCLGSKVWSIRTPAGTKMTTPCQRCATRYSSLRTDGGNSIPSLTVWVLTPAVRRLTIGSVRIDTGADADKRVSYMCDETGIGSGTIHYETNLYQTEDEAMASAKEMCAAKNMEAQETPQAMAAQHFAEMTVKPAFRAADWQSVYSSWATARWHKETIDTVLENENGDYAKIDDIRDYLDQRSNDLKRYEFIDRHPFEALLVAARKSNDPAVREIAEAMYCKFPSGDDAASEVEAEELSI